MGGLYKRRQKLSLRADDLHSVGNKKIAWLIEGIHVNAKNGGKFVCSDYLG